ncbi:MULTISPECIES: DUF2267 domain-containing protein [Streptosporangium]|uniref:Uncharacterized protein (DUF2267 family) n=1 Tax=Streptosporangium brasiliense TaxID=47480 RepID=A0ABT9R3Z6_9ACTN|nr:DUF2267 domain-containing protein [Streptosporangium brasiliense]MDP9863955.1 uncharacterized protein (DUF2267 family) [Streptosporangium brasiliense]
MDYQEFVTIVGQVADISDEEAESVTRLTLRTLARRVTPGEAERLGRRLPEPLRPSVEPTGPPERFHVDEFVRRIAEHTGLDAEAVAEQARGVLAALWRAVGPDGFEDLRAELPPDFYPLMDTAVAAAPPPAEDEPPFTGRLSGEELLDRVAEGAPTDRARARRATEAVLEMLGLRLPAGQADGLTPLLPPPLRPALRRGRARGRGGTVPLSPDVFLHDVAMRAGADRAEAARDVRAVFAALRETIGDREYHDTVAQLPGEYRPLMRQG